MAEFIKNDTGKLRYDLVPWEALASIVSVLTFGANKYSDDNWKQGFLKDAQTLNETRDRYYAATIRHLEAWRSGQLIDTDSGKPHLACAACCVIFLLWDCVRNARKPLLDGD